MRSRGASERAGGREQKSARDAREEEDDDDDEEMSGRGRANDVNRCGRDVDNPKYNFAGCESPVCHVNRRSESVG